MDRGSPCGGDAGALLQFVYNVPHQRGPLCGCLFFGELGIGNGVSDFDVKSLVLVFVELVDKIEHGKVHFESQPFGDIGKIVEEVRVSASEVYGHNGIAWSFGSWNVFYQYILADEVLYVA